MQNKNPLNNWSIIIILCLTLGLAPFFPEPHIVGKLRWIAGGAEGMGKMDWFDFAFHGWPWALLLRLIVVKGYNVLKLKVRGSGF